MRGLLLFFVICILLFTSCQKNEDLYAINPELTLIGHWEWVSSSGGIAGLTYTPASTGKHQKVVFNADSVFSFYVNDSLVIESKFSVSKSMSIFSTDSTEVISFETFPIRKSYYMTADGQLTLMDECADCFSHGYRRLK